MSKLDIALNEIDRKLNQPAVREDQEVIAWWFKVAKYYTGDYKFVSNK